MPSPKNPLVPNPHENRNFTPYLDMLGSINLRNESQKSATPYPTYLTYLPTCLQRQKNSTAVNEHKQRITDHGTRGERESINTINIINIINIVGPTSLATTACE